MLPDVVTFCAFHAGRASVVRTLEARERDVHLHTRKRVELGVHAEKALQDSLQERHTGSITYAINAWYTACTVATSLGSFRWVINVTVAATRPQPLLCAASERDAVSLPKHPAEPQLDAACCNVGGRPPPS